MEYADTHELCLPWRRQTGPSSSGPDCQLQCWRGRSSGHEFPASSDYRVKLCLKHTRVRKTPLGLMVQLAREHCPGLCATRDRPQPHRPQGKENDHVFSLQEAMQAHSGGVRISVLCAVLGAEPVSICSCMSCAHVRRPVCRGRGAVSTGFPSALRLPGCPSLHDQGLLSSLAGAQSLTRPRTATHQAPAPGPQPVQVHPDALTP